MYRIVLILALIASLVFGAAHAETDAPKDSPDVTAVLAAVREVFAEAHTPLWVFLVKQGPAKGKINSACAERNGLNRRRAALALAEKAGVPSASLPPDADDIVRQIGKEVATGLLAVFKEVPRAERNGVRCVGAPLDLFDEIAVLDEIIAALADHGHAPEDIGATDTQLRDMAREEFRRQLAVARGEKEQGRPGRFFAVFSRARENWHFTPDELLLTPRETEQVTEWSRLNSEAVPAPASGVVWH